MPVYFNNNTFNDRATGVRNYYDTEADPIDFEKIEKELHEILNCLDGKTADYWAVRELEGAAKRRDWDALVKSAKDFALQFGSATLANLAGGYLSGRLGL